jgi:Lon protease-like protein
VKPLTIGLALFLLSPMPAHAGVSEGAQAVVLRNDNPPPEPASLPSEIPLFPLPEVSLFPGVSRPFIIFEPRYREMVADALERDRIIGMVALRPGFEKDYEGRPPIYEIGCAGQIQQYEKLPDGRYLILLRGLTTFRVTSEDQRKPYRLAHIEAVAESLKTEELGQLSTLRERLTQLLYVSLPLGVEPPDPGLDDAEFVNVTALNLRMPEADRQALLERNSVVARARALVDRLDRK